MFDPLHTALLATAERHDMLSSGDTVLVAVSGGQDSCALLHALHSLRDHWNLTLHAAHYDHCLRGEESEADARFVQGLAAGLSIPCALGKGDVASAARRLHRSRQEVAREMRSRFLQEVAHAVGADRIATGHTHDDRVETVLLRILRGTGVDGLQGIAPISRNCIRPLLHVRRNETAAYCMRHGIEFRTDATNTSLRYARNRVREELLPLLTTHYNEQVGAALLRLSDLATEDAAFLAEEARSRFARVAVNIEGDRVVLSVAALRKEPLAMQRRIVRLGVERVRGSLADVGQVAIDRVLAMGYVLEEGPRFQYILAPGDTRVVGENGRLVVERRDAPGSLLRVWQVLAIPGATRMEPWGLEIRAENGPAELPKHRNPNLAVIDQAAVRGDLVARTRRPGDRLQPLGMAGTRKVQDILVDRKVPREERDRVPIVADNEGILWVAGHALSERARLRDGCRSAIRLEVRSIPASIGPSDS